jgi:hypothetical protein
MEQEKNPALRIFPKATMNAKTAFLYKQNKCVYSSLFQEALCSRRSLSATIAMNSLFVGLALLMLTV